MQGVGLSLQGFSARVLIFFKKSVKVLQRVQPELVADSAQALSSGTAIVLDDDILQIQVNV
jgi:hypothetical protein